MGLEPEAVNGLLSYISLSTITPWNPTEQISPFTPKTGCVMEGVTSFKKFSQSEGRECEEGDSDSLQMAKEGDLEPERGTL